MQNKFILLVGILLLSLTSFSQIEFEPGYLIDNNNQRIDCLIKNQDWKNNPNKIRYKTSENDEPEIASIEEIKEFGLNNQSKYIRAIVDIDRSSDELSKLTKERNPVFETETLFLKVLLEGESTLYSYTEGNLHRFFFNSKEGKIEQLVYKRYMGEAIDLKSNKLFRQQLYLAFANQGISADQTERLKYEQHDLIRFFERLQDNQAEGLTNYIAKEKRDPFNLRFTVAANNSSFPIENSSDNSLNVDFGSKINCSIGLEAEFVLPFNKGKWAFIVAPEFRQLKSEKTVETSSVSQGEMNAVVDYKSIDLPVGVRYYFYLAPTSRIFLQTAYTPNFALSSKITLKRADGTVFNELDITTTNNMSYSIGYNYKRINIELNYGKRNMLSDYITWQSELKNLSLKLAYQLF